MADGEIEESRGDQEAPKGKAARGCTEFRVELRDRLPGDRAVIGVEQDGEITLIASRKYVQPKAVEDLLDTIGRMIREGSLAHSWPGV